jgi:hypothetical protein
LDAPLLCKHLQRGGLAKFPNHDTINGLTKGPFRMNPIALLNDTHRRSLARCFVTAGVTARFPKISTLLEYVRSFDAFTPDNDPYGEHDCAGFTVGGVTLIWKIDTFADHSLTTGADDPLAPGVVRVLTVMLAEEY